MTNSFVTQPNGMYYRIIDTSTNYSPDFTNKVIVVTSIFGNELFNQQFPTGSTPIDIPVTSDWNTSGALIGVSVEQRYIGNGVGANSVTQSYQLPTTLNIKV